jgi:hypothetical protein
VDLSTESTRHPDMSIGRFFIDMSDGCVDDIDIWRKCVDIFAFYRQICDAGPDWPNNFGLCEKKGLAYVKQPFISQLTEQKEGTLLT